MPSRTFFSWLSGEVPKWNGSELAPSGYYFDEVTDYLTLIGIIWRDSPAAGIIVGATEFQGAVSTTGNLSTSANLSVSGTDHAGWNTIVASADQDVTNASNTDHTQFQFAVTADKSYIIEAEIAAAGNDATGAYECRLTVAAGTMNARGNALYVNNNDSAANTMMLALAAASSTQLNCTVTEEDLKSGSFIRIQFHFSPSNTTTMKFQFGNVTAAAGRTSRTQAGSIFKWKQVSS